MKKVETDKAPKVVGPYSQAIVAGDFVFCSGQIAIDPATGDLVSGGIQEQTEQVFRNLQHVVEAAGSKMSAVVSVAVYLKNMDDYAVMNELYAAAFSADPKPARVAVGVAKLPKDALVEISCVAILQ